MVRLGLALAAVLVLLAPGTIAQPRMSDPPAQVGSGMAFLTTDAKGVAYLSWIDPLPSREHALRYAQWTGSGWSAPSTIASGPKWFVNWADFPALAVLPDGSMMAHWLTRSEGAGSHGYGVRVARKAPGAAAWKEVFGASLDNKEDYAGFLSFVGSGRSMDAVYLAPPSGSGEHAASGGEHRKTLRAVAFSPNGKVTSDREIDSSVCSCCQTTAVATPKGPLVAYRDRLPGEIRDISVIRQVDGSWTQPRPLHRDGWEINGCPTEGPSAAVTGDRVGIAWMTAAQDNPRMQMVFSNNSGKDFGEPIRIDDGRPLGRPAVAAFDANHFLVAWIERMPEGKAEVRLRRVSTSGVKFPAVTVASVTSGRSTGLPKVVLTGDQILLAWRNDQVRSGWYSKSQFLSLENRQ